MRTALLVCALGVSAVSTLAEAQPRQRYQWDTKGWVMLGEETVDYARHSRRNRDGSDTDRITVGRYEGKFSKLQLVVDDSDMTLVSMKIVFADNTEYNPKLAYEFKEGQRTRAFDLPPSENRIQYIDLDYKNAGKRDGEKARVQVWGYQVGSAQPARRHQWDTTGWAMLGEQTVDYARRTRRNRDGSDTDRITVGTQDRFKKLQLVVDDSDLTLISVRVTLGNNEVFDPKLAYDFKEGQRTRVIDLPGEERMIKYIDLDYKNSGKRDGQKARVQVWGQKVVARPVVQRAKWDTTGWTMLGELTVDYGRHVETDRISVGRYEGRFNKLQLVVDDSDMSLANMKIVFADNTEYNPKLAYDFKEGQRTRAIDLPPAENTIRYIDLTYKNSGKRDGEKARVQVWGYKIAGGGGGHRPRR